MQGCPFRSQGCKDAESYLQSVDNQFQPSDAGTKGSTEDHLSTEDLTYSAQRILHTPFLVDPLPAACLEPGAIANVTAEAPASAPTSSITTASAAPPFQTNTHIPPWLQRRPDAASCPKLTRRQLRLAGLTYSLKEVAQHKYVDDAWIAVNGSVYDITEHLMTHPGWGAGAADSTVLSILAHSGSECTDEFTSIHRPYPIAWRQLKAFYIGELNPAAEVDQ